ncbi:unnamed protein product [Notodromas monacha]|uniref:Solute carrier family 39 member 9 n=1 Tax=Notodromas monacha TaxID=399045 RepID=A0A7R9GCZ0_9CRUS|nr:unnamed protein product [Notodromas monacha]CAG0916439.1 unnamed protein product [Notodromas monacha]
MSEVWILLSLCLAMLAGCYIAGLIPLVVSLSEEKLQLVSVMGAGLLVGTALAVIIPEGMMAVCEAPKLSAHKAMQLIGADQETKLPDVGSEIGVSVEASSSFAPHSVIGIALVLGFVFMLFVDQFAVFCRKNDNGSPADHSFTSTTTLGLIVHAAADGIALGAAASTSHMDTEMIVFLAIMLHKAPAAFGLVTFLLHSGLERNRIRRHLLLFAVAAPSAAIATYFFVDGGPEGGLATLNGTGFAMLFSAGTFLYVSLIHVLPEVSQLVGGGHGFSHEQLPTAAPGAAGKSIHAMRRLELIALVIGCLLPVLLAMNHHH